MTEQENVKVPNIFLRLTALILGLLALIRICLTASVAYHPFLIVIGSLAIVFLCVLVLRKSLPVPFWPKGGFSLLSQVSLAAAFILIVLGVSRNYIVNPEKVTASQEKVESTQEEAPEPIPVAEPTEEEKKLMLAKEKEFEEQQKYEKIYQDALIAEKEKALKAEKALANKRIEQANQFITLAIKNNLILDVMPYENTFMVNPMVWNSFPYDDKKTAMGLFIDFCELKCSMKDFGVYLKDGYTNKQIWYGRRKDSGVIELRES